MLCTQKNEQSQRPSGIRAEENAAVFAVRQCPRLARGGTSDPFLRLAHHAIKVLCTNKHSLTVFYFMHGWIAGPFTDVTVSWKLL